MKKITRRNSVKYPALEPRLNLKTRTDLIDFDYVEKLNDKEKAWLNSFCEEYHNANMKHPGKKIHKTKKQQRDCYTMNNARNRDILTRSKACGKAISIHEVTETDNTKNNPEDKMIEALDNKRSGTESED